MTDLEIVEQQLEELKEKVEDLVNEAEVKFKSAFQGGYDQTEKFMYEGFEKLNEITNLL